MFTRLYLHIPFCLSKCGYCAFNSQEIGSTDLNNYVDLLIAEMLLAKETAEGRRLDSIYFGGGTPSLLNGKQIGRLIEKISDLFRISPECEITLEANPGTVDQEKLAAFRNAGINRLSLGFQSFNDTFLKYLGRVHNSLQAKQAIKDARSAGFNNISIDLMHSLPSQNIREWRADLEQAIQLAPEHLSIYGLTVEEGTPFHLRYPYGSPERPDDDLSADMFELADDLLTAAGYEHYEIANYANPGYRSRHNSGYWHRDGYLGLGVGAHSFLKDGDGVRYSNVDNLKEYPEMLTSGCLPYIENQRLSRDEAMAEFVFLGLRLADGIDFRVFEKEFVRSFLDVYGTVTKGLIQAELLIQEQDSIRLTRRGMLLSNQVFNRFLK
jgi:oxygen-independent coproporphyrinogen-3 oxidase